MADNRHLGKWDWLSDTNLYIGCKRGSAERTPNPSGAMKKIMVNGTKLQKLLT